MTDTTIVCLSLAIFAFAAGAALFLTETKQWRRFGRWWSRGDLPRSAPQNRRFRGSMRDWRE